MHVKCRKEIEQHQQLITELQEQLVAKNKRISELTSLLDKYQSVFSLSSSLSTPTAVVKTQQQSSHMDANNALFGFGGSVPPHGNDLTVQTRKRGIGISAEPQNEDEIQSKELKSHPKSENVRKLIKGAIMENDFMIILH
ncbi:unnamed protein product [Heterobilharzia americana]|nr:unnamed protein product [Heterobilharzia americana]